MTFWSGNKLKQQLSSIIDEPDESHIDCASYRLCLGGEIYVTPHADDFDPQTSTKRILTRGEPFTVPAGQFAFLLTKEVVEIPVEVIGFISIRAKYKFRGLVNVSGFHVDPGYKGRLIFSVFNAGPSPVHLEEGEDLFLMWLADLDSSASSQYSRASGTGYYSIPTSLINDIPGELYSLQGLSRKIADTNAELNKRIFEMEKIQTRHTVYVRVAAVVIVSILAWSARGIVAEAVEFGRAKSPVAASVQPSIESGSSPTGQATDDPKK